MRDEAKRIKAEQEKELSKFQNVLKNRKKEVKTICLIDRKIWLVFAKSEMPFSHIGSKPIGLPHAIVSKILFIL